MTTLQEFQGFVGQQLKPDASQAAQYIKECQRAEKAHQAWLQQFDLRVATIAPAGIREAA